MHTPLKYTSPLSIEDAGRQVEWGDQHQGKPYAVRRWQKMCTNRW